jgi:hypothetical protein
MYSYLSSGSINIAGCSRIGKDIFVLYKWGERSVVYFKPKAMKGIIEKIAVKRVVINYIEGKFRPIYVDTLNSLYNEEELIGGYEANLLAQTYIDNERFKLAENLRICGSNTI